MKRLAFVVPRYGENVLGGAETLAREMAQPESHDPEGGEVAQRAGDDDQRELRRTGAGRDLEPRGLATHGVPDGPSHEIEGHGERNRRQEDGQNHPLRIVAVGRQILRHQVQLHHA